MNETDTDLPWIKKEESEMFYYGIENHTSELSESSDLSKRLKGMLTDEERLTSMLFISYASSLRPVYESNKSVEVLFALNLIKIDGMDEINQVLELSVWMEMVWSLDISFSITSIIFLLNIDLDGRTPEMGSS